MGQGFGGLSESGGDPEEFVLASCSAFAFDNRWGVDPNPRAKRPVQIRLMGWSRHGEPPEVSFAGRIRFSPWTPEIAWHYGEVYRALAARGQLIGANDLWIAATALAHDFGLVKGNPDEFIRVPGLAWTSNVPSSCRENASSNRRRIAWVVLKRRLRISLSMGWAVGGGQWSVAGARASSSGARSFHGRTVPRSRVCRVSPP